MPPVKPVLPAPPLEEPWFLRSSRRFFAGLTGLLLVFTAVFICFLGMETRRSLRANAMTENRLSAQLAAKAVDEHFDGMLHFVESYTLRPSLIDAIRDGNAAVVRARLEEMLRINPDLDDAYITDPAGVKTFVLSGEPGQDASAHDWYKNASRSGRPFISEIYLRSGDWPEPVLGIVVPVRDAGGSVLAYLVAQHPLKRLSEWFEQARPSPGGTVSLFDQRGRLATGFRPGDPLPPALGRRPEWKEFIQDPDGVLEAPYPPTGEPSLIFLAPIPSTGWTVMAGQSLRHVYSPLNYRQVTLTVLAVLFFAGALILLFHFLWFNAVRQYHRIRLKDEQSLLQTASIINNSEDGIVATTLEGVVTGWNLAAEKIYGYSAHEMTGRSVAVLIPASHPDEMPGILRKIRAGERLDQFETVRVRKDGRQIDVSLTISPIYDPSGRITGCSAIARDITHRKMLERRQAEQAELLARSNEQLARRQRVMVSLLEDLHESKTKLEEQKRSLQEANERLASLNAMKDEFVATASHELRTPLTAIREGISLLRDRVLGPINDEQGEFLTTVDENIDRLTELISNILDLSKIEAGRFALFRRRLNLGERIRALIRENQKLAGQRTLESDLQPVPDVWADGHRIAQVLWNLFSNAVKFTPETGHIRFSLRREKDQVLISVSDDGVGISPDDLPKLFQRFSQVGEKCYRGTGLGLALCKQIVELHKGAIGVQSEAGKGSIFTFSLPVYSRERVLEEYFNEQLELARQKGRPQVGLLLFEKVPVGAAPNGSPLAPEDEAERAIEFLRPHFFPKDSVFAVEPGWIAVMAAVDADGLRAMAGRLSAAFSDELAKFGRTPSRSGVRCGSALYPHHGNGAQSLFEAAAASLGAAEVHHVRT